MAHLTCHPKEAKCHSAPVWTCDAVTSPRACFSGDDSGRCVSAGLGWGRPGDREGISVGRRAVWESCPRAGAGRAAETRGWDSGVSWVRGEGQGRLQQAPIRRGVCFFCGNPQKQDSTLRNLGPASSALQRQRCSGQLESPSNDLVTCVPSPAQMVCLLPAPLPVLLMIVAISVCFSRRLSAVLGTPFRGVTWGTAVRSPRLKRPRLTHGAPATAPTWLLPAGPPIV